MKTNRISSLILGIVLFVTLSLPDNVAANQFKYFLTDQSDTPTAGNLFQQSQNDLIAVYTGGDCSFVIGTLKGDPQSSLDDNRRLLFGYPNNPGTSYPTIRIIDDSVANNYVLTKIPASAGPSQEGITSVCTWSLDTVDIVQRLTPVANPFSGRTDTIRIEYEITNTTTRNIDAGLRGMLDMMIGENDYAPFFIPRQGNITKEMEFQANSVPDFYKAFESADFSVDSLKGQGILRGYGATPPDRFALATWNTGRGGGRGVVNFPWDYDITSNAEIGDSTAVLWWNPKTLAPRQSLKYITYFGLAGPGGGASWIDAPSEVSPAAPNFQVTLRVSNQTNQPFTGGNVTLTLAQGITSSDPLQQNFPDVQAGQTGSLSWNLALSDNAGGNLTISTVTRFSNLADPLNAQATIFVPPPPDPSTSRPVILIPGMGASYNSDLAGKLPGSSYDESKWEWTGVGWPVNQNAGSMSYSGLIDAFEHAGYSTDKGYFTVAFYDWRGPIPDSGKRLKQVIDEVKKKTGATTVDIVAHSMGGLVAREYITSDYYQNDVSHLVTLGSPFNGSVNPYYYVGGGELYGFDFTLSAVLKIRFINPFMCFGTLHSPCWHRDVDIINNVAKGLYDVLPNFDYIYDNSTGEVTPAAALYFKNRYLPNSNAKNQLLLGRTKVLNVAGNEQDTLNGLNVKPYPASLLMWQDGEPIPIEQQRKSKDGDGTVLKDSALISGAESYAVNVDHGGYMGNGEIQQRIFEFFGIRSPVGDFPSIHYASSLVIAVASPIDISVIDPQGRILTSANTQIPNAFYLGTGTSGPYAAVILDPLAGDYSIKLTGTSDGEYHFIADYEVNNGQPQGSAMDYEFSGFIQSNAVVDITARLDPAQVNPFIFTSMTPEIALPVYTGDTTINGYATPGSSIEIAEQNGAVVANGQTNQISYFSITLANALKRGQIIVAHSNGKTSIPVIVQDKPLGEKKVDGSGAGVGVIFMVLIIGAVVIIVLQNRKQRIQFSTPRTGLKRSASLMAISGTIVGQSIALADNYLIGRGRECQVHIPDRAVSRQHARIRYANGHWYIQDLKSAGGTFLNGTKVLAAPLKPGDRIRIGSSEFEFRE
jgi:hypothetical protein